MDWKMMVRSEHFGKKSNGATVATATSALGTEISSKALKKLTSWKVSLLGFAVAFFGLAPCSIAAAQDVGGATRELPRQSTDHLLVGVGMLATPTYQGSDDYRVIPLPIIDVAVGPFFANLRNGFGVNVIDAGPVKIGASVALMPGYRRQDVPEGVDRVTVGAGGRLFASLDVAGANLTIGATQGVVGSTKGAIADASIAYPIFFSPRFMLIPSLGTTWADSKHNDRYFGINARSSLASGLPEYDVGGGFKDATVGITGSYRLSDRINLLATGSVTTLLGDVRRSPLVKERTQPTAVLSLAYRL